MEARARSLRSGQAKNPVRAFFFSKHPAPQFSTTLRSVPASVPGFGRGAGGDRKVSCGAGALPAALAEERSLGDHICSADQYVRPFHNPDSWCNHLFSVVELAICCDELSAALQMSKLYA